MRVIFSVLLVALALTACNSYKSKLQPQNQDMVLPSSIDYAFVSDKVFSPHCVRCHNIASGNKGGVNLETYENVIANLQAIEDTALIEKSMPPSRAGGPLGEYEQNVLKLWLDSGAPRDAHSGPANPTPAPTPMEPVEEPSTGAAPLVEPRWDSIYTHIIEPKCVSCHQVGAKAEEYPLTERTYVIDESNLMIKAGNPEGSELYTSIMRTDRRMMPPAKTGVTLSEQEKDAVRIWILNGAKD